MAIRDWHGGQLVVIWAALVFANFVLFIAAYYIRGPVVGPILGVAFLVAFIGGIPWGLVLTWKWFGSRKKLSA